VFQGASELTLDAKGRVAVPTRHRDALASAGGSVVLTAHPDRCVLLYPRLSWEPIGAKVQALSSFNEQARMWQRLLVGFAEELELDAQGRILISPALRKFDALLGGEQCMQSYSHPRFFFEQWFKSELKRQEAKKAEKKNKK
jgi:MraZ protein